MHIKNKVYIYIYIYNIVNNFFIIVTEFRLHVNKTIY